MPCWTSARATAAPIPTEAPVTRATLPFHRSISLVLSTPVLYTKQQLLCGTSVCLVQAVTVAAISIMYDMFKLRDAAVSWSVQHPGQRRAVCLSSDPCAPLDEIWRTLPCVNVWFTSPPTFFLSPGAWSALRVWLSTAAYWRKLKQYKLFYMLPSKNFRNQKLLVGKCIPYHKVLLYNPYLKIFLKMTLTQVTTFKSAYHRFHKDLRFDWTLSGWLISLTENRDIS